MTVQRMCKNCGKSIIVWSTAQTRCPKCQQARSKAKPPKPIKKAGKKYNDWRKYRKGWLETNKPNDDGFYECYICGKWLIPKETTLDHVIPRSNRPDLSYDESNIRPCCFTCNTAKGSKSIDIVRSEYDRKN